MKLKKVAAICAKQGAFYLFDELEEGGELIRQWLGDGRSAYPLSGLPVLDHVRHHGEAAEEVCPRQKADAGRHECGGLR